MSWSSFRRTLAAALCTGLTGITGCSSADGSSDGGVTGCSVRLSGNVTETETEAASLPACSTLRAATGGGGAGETVLELQVSSTKLAGLTVSVALGASPSPGRYSSETVSDWSAEGLSAGNSDCAYSAGSAAVPTGSFALDLTSVTRAGPGGSAHGTIALQTYVHAPPATDCGAGDVETVQIDF
jgi:hypothetical protein